MMEMVIVSPSGRKRENLLSMLESFNNPSSIKITETCEEALSVINPTNPAVIFIDYRDSSNVTAKEVSNIILNKAVTYIVLLVSRNSPTSHFTHFSSCELIYDEITIDMLSNLLRNIQLKADMQM